MVLSKVTCQRTSESTAHAIAITGQRFGSDTIAGITTQATATRTTAQTATNDSSQTTAAATRATAAVGIAAHWTSGTSAVATAKMATCRNDAK